MVVSQVISVVQDEVIELPPYADSILIESSGSIVLKHSPDNATYYAIDLDNTGLAAGLKKPTTGLLFKYLQFTTLTGTAKIHYRISKR